jgi:hypothetical protein
MLIASCGTLPVTQDSNPDESLQKFALRQVCKLAPDTTTHLKGHKYQRNATESNRNAKDFHKDYTVNVSFTMQSLL